MKGKRSLINFLLISSLLITLYIKWNVIFARNSTIDPSPDDDATAHRDCILQNMWEKMEQTNKSKSSSKIVYLKEPKNIKLFQNNIFPCNPSKVHFDWAMVLFVKSAGGNIERRDLIRRTWAAVSYLNGGIFQTVFITGKAVKKTQRLLDEEYKLYKDILQINESDNYLNIRFKTLAGMQWASENLPNEYYYSIVDDDIMINIEELTQFINEQRNYPVNKYMLSYKILCIYEKVIDFKPDRRSNSKWYTSYEEYVWPVWPDFCLGGMYSTSVKVARKLLALSRTEKIVNMDDVWITGILREKLGIPRQFVISTHRSIAIHCNSYVTNEPVYVEQNMRDKWKTIFDKLKHKQMCFHEYTSWLHTAFGLEVN